MTDRNWRTLKINPAPYGLIFFCNYGSGLFSFLLLSGHSRHFNNFHWQLKFIYTNKIKWSNKNVTFIVMYTRIKSHNAALYQPSHTCSLLHRDLSIEADLPKCMGLNMWGVTEWMIKNDGETHRLLHWFQLWSQPARCRVFGKTAFEKNLWKTERGSDWLRLLSDYEQEQCATDKQALTSENWKSKMFETFETVFIKKRKKKKHTEGSETRRASSHRHWKHVFAACARAPAAYHHMHLLPTLLCPALHRRCCRLNGGTPNNSFSFSLSFPFVQGQSDPCLAPGVRFLDPALLQPSPSYLHPCRPQWMIHLERLPSTIRKLCNYTLQPSLRSSDLTMLCNAWKTLAFLYLFLFFFHAPSLALFLSYIQYWLFMLFNVVERARGLWMGEKRSSWHTYAPVVNSSSQHSSKYTDLLLFPLPPFCVYFAPSFFLQLGAPLNISTPCSSTPKITLWKIKMLKCSSKIFTQ